MSNDTSYLLTDSVQEEKRDLHSFLRLVHFATLQRWLFSGGFLLLMISSAFAMYSAHLLGQLVDQGLILKDQQASLHFALLIVGCELCVVLLTWWGRRILTAASLSSIFEIRRQLFAHMESLPLSYYDRTPQGRTVTRMTFDVESLEEFFSSSMGKLLSSFIIAGAALVAMLYTNFFLGSIVALAVIPAVILTVSTRNSARALTREISRRNSAVNAQLSEFLNGLNVIRMLGLEEWTQKRFDRLVDAHKRSNVSLINMYSWVRPGIGLLSMLPLLLLLWYGVHWVASASMTVGALVSFIRYFERFGRPMMELSLEIHIVQQAFTSAERVTTFLKETEENDELGTDGTLLADTLQGQVEFRDVHMSYGKKVPALKGVSFQAAAGQKIGLTGATGSGKSSTVALMARLYEFYQGELFIDQRSIREFQRLSLRSRLGFVSQEVMIVQGSVKDNLTFGKEISDQKINYACDQTGLSAVFKRNSMTLDSLLFEQGSNLSAGERQLLSLTRVFLQDPAILVLDEATANMDPALEELVHNAMDQVMQGRTSFIIAHRLQTLRNCDRVLVFRDGVIEDQGSHDELMIRDGYYAALWKKF